MNKKRFYFLPSYAALMIAVILAFSVYFLCLDVTHTSGKIWEYVSYACIALIILFALVNLTILVIQRIREKN